MHTRLSAFAVSSAGESEPADSAPAAIQGVRPALGRRSGVLALGSLDSVVPYEQVVRLHRAL